MLLIWGPPFENHWLIVTHLRLTKTLYIIFPVVEMGKQRLREVTQTESKL